MKKKKSYFDTYENPLHSDDDFLIDTPAHKNLLDSADSEDTRKRIEEENRHLEEDYEK